MGTADFAVTSLERMVEAELNIVAVYTQPPRPAGRGQKLRMSPVGIFAQKNKMKLLTPLNFSTGSDLQTFKSLKALVTLTSFFRSGGSKMVSTTMVLTCGIIDPSA